MAAPRRRCRRLPLSQLLAMLPVACAAPAPREDAGAVLQQVMASHQASLASVGFAAAARPAHPAEGSQEPPPSSHAARRRGGTASPPPPPPPPSGTPSYAGQLVGQPPETVLRWLGPPRLRRAEGGAEIWHYQASACHLDLVLYRDREGAAPPAPLRVAYASARASGPQSRSETACLRELARPPAAAPRQEGARFGPETDA
jgi:hypothetical protein